MNTKRKMAERPIRINEKMLCCFFLGAFICIAASCSRLEGWGVLLWSTDEIPSGTVLPVIIRSNIEQVYVAGAPSESGNINDGEKIEFPLWQLHVEKSKRAAEAWAENFKELALSYGETLQDGLPVRDEPGNQARRVYRLRRGEIVKILSRVEGEEAVGTDGSPLEGNWYEVLTGSGVSGYCFSYRLRIFDQSSGETSEAVAVEEDGEDPKFDTLLSKAWTPDIYETMYEEQKLDLEELNKQYTFTVDMEAGKAHLKAPSIQPQGSKTKGPDVDRNFNFTKVNRVGDGMWYFEGTTLQVTLINDSTITIQYTDAAGSPKGYRYTVLPAPLKDIIAQENGRRAVEFRSILSRGPSFQSANYGAFTLNSNRRFTWTDFSSLVPQVIPASAQGNGVVEMGLFIDKGLNISPAPKGAFTLNFTGGGRVNFLYYLDDNGIRLEYLPASAIEENVVKRRAIDPVVIYFNPAQ